MKAVINTRDASGTYNPNVNERLASGLPRGLTIHCNNLWMPLPGGGNRGNSNQSPLKPGARREHIPRLKWRESE